MVVIEALAAYGLYNIFRDQRSLPSSTQPPNAVPCSATSVPVTTKLAEAAGNLRVTVNDTVASLVPKLEAEIQKARAAARVAEESLAAAFQQNAILNEANSMLQRKVQSLEKARQAALSEEARLQAKIVRLMSRSERSLVGVAQTTAIQVLIHAPLAFAIAGTVRKVSQLRSRGRLRVHIDWLAVKRSIWSVRVDGPSARYQPTRSPAAELDCIVCHANQRDVLLMPCRHLALCWPCSEALAADAVPECPLCRQVVTALQYAVVA
jgi:hypothetical protein